MSKIFTYTKFTKHHYCDFSDEWEEDGVEFDYEVENKDLLPIIVDLLFEDYFAKDRIICSTEKKKVAVKEKLKKILDENDLVEVFADQYEDTLKEIFCDNAMDYYNG